MWRRSISQQHPGQGLVEFSLIITILAFLLAGALDLGRAYSAAVQLENMARAGAQYGTIAASLGDDDPEDGMRAAALAEQSAIFGVTPTITSSGTDVEDDSGYCQVSVTASYRFDPIMFLPGIDTPIEMSRTSTMRVQFPPSGSSCT